MKKELVKKAVMIAGVCLALGACGSIYEKEPVGVGDDISELKRSPCACMLLKMPQTLPDWLMTANG